MKKVRESEIVVQESKDEIYDSGLLSSNRERGVDLNVQVWSVSTVLAPQDISLMLRLDMRKRKVSLRLRNNGSNGGT